MTDTKKLTESENRLAEGKTTAVSFYTSFMTINFLFRCIFDECLYDELYYDEFFYDEYLL